MMKLFKRFPWIFIIILQSLLGIGAGFLLLANQNVDTVSGLTKLNGLSIGGMSFKEAKDTIKNHYRIQTEKGVLFIEIDKKTTSLPYSEFDVSVDTNKTFENFLRIMPANGLEQFFFSQDKEILLKPVFTYNSGKLIKSCETLFTPLEITPVPERYEVRDGILKMIPRIPGREVDYARLELELKDELFSQPQSTYIVDAENSSLFLKTGAESGAEVFTALVSHVKIPFSIGLEEKVRSSLQAFQGRIVDMGHEMSLKDLIDFSQFTNDVEKDLLNRIATAIHQSALPIEGVEILNRKPSVQPVSYTQPGLEAVIEGEEANLLIKNETKRPLMLLFETSKDSLTFYLASTGTIRSGILITEKKDQVPPPIITSVNKNLSPSETKVVSEGVPGFTVYVSRVIDNEQFELHMDKYKPISKIVEIGEKAINTSTK